MFNSKSFYALKSSMNGLTARQRAIASNIANVDTPGYKALSTSFEDELKSQLDSMRVLGPTTKGTQLIKPLTKYQPTTALKSDGNNVDIDEQMAELAETQLRFEAASMLISRKYQSLRNVIMEGKR